MTVRQLMVVTLFLVIFSFGLARETDIDFWWHFRTGELIARTSEIPRTDPFSFTVQGRPWVVHEWLWELTAYHLCQHGGYVVAVVLSATLITLTYWILYSLLRR